MDVHEKAHASWGRTPAPTPSGSFPLSARYQVLAAIASGDSGTLYVGALRGPNGFERRITIKRAHPRVVREPRARRRFVEEARLVAALNHPNVVSVHDVEDVNGELLLITDYVEGVSLAQLLDVGRVSARVAGRILLDVAMGLAAIHALADTSKPLAEIVHTDVSAANILVGTDGRSRLSGVGIAKGSQVTAPMGVFALGKVAWETFTSRPLFASIRGGRTNTGGWGADPIGPPSALQPDLTPEIDAIVLRALARNPAERGTAAQLAADLEETLAKGGLLGTRLEVEEEVIGRCGKSIADERKRLRVATTTGRSAIRATVSATPPPAPLSGSRRHAGAGDARRGIIGGAVFATAVLLGAATWCLLGQRPGETSFEAATPRTAIEFPASTSTTLETSALATAPRPPTTATSLPSAAVAPRAVAHPHADPPRAPPAAIDCEQLADRAAARRAAHDLAGAEILYREALTLNARYLPARLGSADLDWDLGRTAKASRAYRALIDEYAGTLLPDRVAARAAPKDGGEPAKTGAELREGADHE